MYGIALDSWVAIFLTYVTLLFLIVCRLRSFTCITRIEQSKFRNLPVNETGSFRYADLTLGPKLGPNITAERSYDVGEQCLKYIKDRRQGTQKGTVTT